MSASSSDTQVVQRKPGAEVEEHPPEAAVARSAEPAGGETGIPTTTAWPRLSQGGLGLLGVLTLLLGAWGGIVPFVAPSFTFSAVGSVSWYWDLAHALLWLAPGAVACFCGLVMLGLVPRAHAGLGRLGSATTGLLTAVCGAWFVIGPLAWPVLERSGGVFVPASPMKELAYQVGYSLGPGILLSMFGAFAVAWAVRAVSPSKFPGWPVP
ncbi:MAG TPA: hypothetical protein VMR97_10970 [Acidimicrobiales bacterium]|nr:hypothetical protein [Acidimicrobiales bacterium]